MKRKFILCMALVALLTSCSKNGEKIGEKASLEAEAESKDQIVTVEKAKEDVEDKKEADQIKAKNRLEKKDKDQGEKLDKKEEKTKKTIGEKKSTEKSPVKKEVKKAKESPKKTQELESLGGKAGEKEAKKSHRTSKADQAEEESRASGKENPSKGPEENPPIKEDGPKQGDVIDQGPDWILVYDQGSQCLYSTSIGNSGKVFDSEDEALDWGNEEYIREDSPFYQYDGFRVDPIWHSGRAMWTVDFYKI